MHIRVAARFNGPPDSGNGGYTAGRIASAIGVPVQVRLLRPIPLERDLEVTGNARGWGIRDDEGPVATAIAHAVETEVPPPPSRVDALEAAQRYTGFTHHDFPHCFVCGPQRADGLRIFAGAVSGTTRFAAPWRPDSSLADDVGMVQPEFVWAALDCPGYFASCNPTVALLGEMSAHLDRVPALDEPCVVTSWPIDQNGRRHRAGTALFGADGARCAFAVSTWITLK